MTCSLDDLHREVQIRPVADCVDVDSKLNHSELAGDRPNDPGKGAVHVTEFAIDYLVDLARMGARACPAPVCRKSLREESVRGLVKTPHDHHIRNKVLS